MIDPLMLRIYRLTCYKVGGISFHIDRRSPGADCLLRRAGRRQAVLVSAWNPRSKRKPDGWNRRMHRALLVHARRIPALPASGGLGRWREDHLLLLTDPRPCLMLARRFRQRAVVTLRTGQPVKLVLLG